MSKINKDECLAILKDVKDVVESWDWDEDYYNSGLTDRQERILWTQERLDKIVELVTNTEF